MNGMPIDAIQGVAMDVIDAPTGWWLATGSIALGMIGIMTRKLISLATAGKLVLTSKSGKELEDQIAKRDATIARLEGEKAALERALKAEQKERREMTDRLLRAVQPGDDQ